MIRELIDDPRVQPISLDKEIWSDFLKYHQMFDLTYSLLKENLEKFLLEKTEIFLEKLIYASQAESETDDNRAANDFKNLRFKKLMPWLQVFYTELIKTFILSIGEILDKSNPQKARNKKFRSLCSKLQTDIEKDIQFVFVRKLGEKILDFVLDFEFCVDKIQELGEIATRSNMNEQVCNWLKESIEQRLLSPGVTTSSIIATYFNIVLTLQILDPDMLNFREVTSSIKKFMKTRSNLVRSIIAFWKDLK